MAIQIKKAVRERIYMKLVVGGPSGSGKTYGSVGVALGLAGPEGKVGVIDTENRSASYYAGRFNFDVIELEAPFTTQKYLEALNAFIQADYDVVVIDSLTHEWAASGGILDQKSQKDARGGNSFSNWNEMKQLHNKFVEVVLQSKIHIVATLRSKMEYCLEQDEKGKSTVRKVGLAPISSDGMEYEFGVMFDVDRNTHLAIASKDRTGLFEGRSMNLDEAIGRELRGWLESGGTPAPLPPREVAQAPVDPPRAPAAAAPPAPPATSTPSPSSPAPARRSRNVPVPNNQILPPVAPEAPRHPDQDEWVDCMAQLFQVTQGMPAATRNALIAQFDAEGAAGLAKLKEEIATLRSVLEPQNQNPGAAFVGMTPPARGQVSQLANDFVDGMEGPDTDEAAGGISPDQYEQLGKLIGAYKINRDSLRVYCSKLNQLLPGANGPTLARMTAQAYTKLREDLQNNTPAANGKTWSQLRVSRINGTPATPYNPAQAAS